MGGASKFALLLATPFSLLHHHRRTSLLRLTRTISVAPLSTAPPRHIALSPLPIKASSSSSSQEFHTQTNYNPIKAEDHFGDPFTPLSSQHLWPEWSKLVDSVSARGYLDDRRPFDIPDDAFVSYDGLPEQFVRDAAACLAFARDKPDILGLLSRRDIEILIENGTAFLFKSALDTESRMRSFLGGSGRSYVVESDKPQTVDLMKYIVSCASNPTASGRNKISNPELTESSVRYLLTELLDMSCRALDTDVNTPKKYQLSGSYEQTSRFLRPKIEMKRGDWICPKCSFMNFARNIKCLECEEPRPKRQLTGGEWECPQCDFHNFGKNLACLRCDCKRPGEASLGSADSRSAWGYNNGNYANKDAVDSRLAANEEKAQRWFSKVLQQNPSGLNDMTTNEDFPEIMPLRKRINRFVVSTRKTPLDRRLANSQNQNNWGNYDTRDGVGATDGSSPLPRSSSQYENSGGNNSTYVPFVPLPADMFAKRTQQSTSEDGKEAAMKSSNPISSKVPDQTGAVNISNESVRREESFRLSEKPSIEASMHNEGKEQEGKSEIWFKRVQELHDVPDVASALSDEDFPEIMPMRKGDNRFVISKKKNRSLTSPAYKRQKSMEQGSNAEFVPFVPFPPDYFAKKDKQQPGSRDSTLEPTDETLSKHSSYEKSGNATPGINDSNEVQRAETQQTSTEQQFGDYRGPTSGNPTSNSIGSQTSSSNSWNTSNKHTASQTSISDESPHRPLENPNVRSGLSGKSLEGSAVKEPDPLDMSEEAKAERWFRRVAQIKDISELSQIPDEDFPSIMPMRKGVNRFVVSKRKTPLERRLTSTQYRKNLPVVNSDHVKKENDNS